jgi:hypothetical protein
LTLSQSKLNIQLFELSEELFMDACYRSTPKLVGAFFEALYQNPTMLFLAVASVSALAGLWWYKANNNPG